MTELLDRVILENAERIAGTPSIVELLAIFSIGVVIGVVVCRM